MFKDSFQRYAITHNKEFRYRGVEPGRLENFSDACFALAITLLLISTSPPSNFEQIRKFVWDLLPFAFCIIFFVLIWYEHFIFYYRYGMRHGRVIVLNTALLIIVLFYVYPLKFLGKLFLIPLSMLLGSEKVYQESIAIISGRDVYEFMVIYGLGASTVFIILMMMYRHALSKAEELELNEIEVFDTKASIRSNLLMGIIPLISVTFAIILRNSPTLAGFLSGFSYFLYMPVMWINGNKHSKARKELLAQLNTPTNEEQAKN